MATRAPGPEDRRIATMLAALAAAQATLDSLERRLTTASRTQAVGIRRRMTKEIERLERQMDRWVRIVMPSLFGPAGSGLTRSALRVNQADTFDDLMKATSFVKDDVKRLSRDIAKRRTELQIQEGLSPDDARRKLSNELDSIGLRFVDKSGRGWNLNTYSELVVRTKSAQAYNTGGILRGVESGVREFRVLDGTDDAICAAANGSTWSAQRCLSNPLGHPQCQRAFAPVVPT